MAAPRHWRVFVCLGVLLMVATLGGCSTDPNDLSSWLEPGPELAPQKDMRVWVVGAPDLVLHSPDGGATWQESHRSDTDILTGDLWAIAFGDEAHGWAVRRGIGSERSTVLATSEGGLTWSWQYPKPNGKLLAVAASGPRHAWAVGRRPGNSFEVPGLVIATTDGGGTWTKQDVEPDLHPFDVVFTDERHGWLLAGDRRDLNRFAVLATSDGGAHWRESFETTAVRLTGLAASGQGNCWVVGYVEHPQSGFITATHDGGEHWTEQQAGTDGQLLDADFPDAQHGWAVGAQGVILTTIDGGGTWTPQRVDERYKLTQVSFIDTRRGFALVGHEALLATVDGGSTWTVVRPSEKEELLTGLACVRSGPAEEQ